jgi:integrase/recombinase XerD
MRQRGKDAYRPWRPGGVTLGYVRNGTYHIDRTIHGQRYRISTGCRTAEAALFEYQRFEKAPTQYVPRGKTGTDWDEAAKAFVLYSEKVKQNTPRHVDHQDAHLANFGAFCRNGARVFGSIDTFRAADIRAFIAAIPDGTATGRKGAGRATTNRHLATLKAFMRWAREVEKITANEADKEVPLLREDKGVNLPTEIPEKRWKRVLLKLAPRWQAACHVLLGAGLRYGELARMRKDDIHAHGIHVPRSKSRNARTVPVSEFTVKAARRLLELGGVPDDTASQLDHRLRSAAKRVRLAPFHAHELRHTYASVSLRNGVDLRALQGRMGHASITTTERYLHANEARDGTKRVVGAPV